MPEEQSPFAVRDSQTNTVQPSPATHNACAGFPIEWKNTNADHASISVNQPYRQQYSGGGLVILKFRVEIQRTQPTHPPANGSCSSGDTKIRNGEEMPLARTSS